MTKYRALQDIPPNVKAGDIVEVKNKLVPAYEKLLRPIAEGASEPEDTDVDNPKKTLVTNPDRNDLKKRATELGINFAPNIPTDRLIELVTEAEKKAAEETDDSSDDSSDGESGEGEGEGGDEE
jgi:hypothetical protein